MNKTRITMLLMVKDEAIKQHDNILDGLKTDKIDETFIDGARLDFLPIEEVYEATISAFIARSIAELKYKLAEINRR